MSIWYAYDELSGMEYEYNTETSEMSSWHDGVGLVHYTAMQLDEFRNQHPDAVLLPDELEG